MIWNTPLVMLAVLCKCFFLFLMSSRTTFSARVWNLRTKMNDFDIYAFVWGSHVFYITVMRPKKNHVQSLNLCAIHTPVTQQTHLLGSTCICSFSLSTTQREKTPSQSQRRHNLCSLLEGQTLRWRVCQSAIFPHDLWVTRRGTHHHHQTDA